MFIGDCQTAHKAQQLRPNLSPLKLREKGKDQGDISEQLFEDYLRLQGLSFEFEKPYPGKSKLVDYTVPFDGRDFFFEVKQFEQKNYPLPTSMAAVDYYGPIRAKIDQAQKKFKVYEEGSSDPAIEHWDNQGRRRSYSRDRH